MLQAMFFSHVVLSIVYALCTSRLIATTPVQPIVFDDFGVKNINQRFDRNESCTFEVRFKDTLNLLNVFDQYLYILGSSNTLASFQLVEIETQRIFEQQLDAKSQPYFMIESTTFNAHSTFHLTVTSKASTDAQLIWLRFHSNLLLQPNVVYHGSIQRRKKRRYAMKLSAAQLPALVQLTPNQNYKEMDIDLYAYTEQSFTMYYFPNYDERNHMNNYVERFLITADDAYFENEMYHFFEVYGSTDSSHENMSYSFQIVTDYDANFLLKHILLVFAFTIAFLFISAIES